MIVASAWAARIAEAGNDNNAVTSMPKAARRMGPLSKILPQTIRLKLRRDSTKPASRAKAVAGLLALLVLASTASAQSQQTGTIRGTVVNARDGAGVGKVAVRLQETRQTTVTDDQGRFEILDVVPGAHELYVSAVDFVLVKRAVDVQAGAAADLTIVLTEGTGSYTETVTVRGTLTTRREPVVAAEQTLGSSDLQQLRGVITNDPLRAVQVLPGVATGDDFRSEFSVRGAGVSQMNFTFEGVATPLLVHTVQQIRETGSIAMVNGDVLDEASLLSGAYPQRYGNRIGAELDFRMREGSRDGVRSHVSISATDAGAVFEGPLGRSSRGSWLVSARKSYLDLVVSRLYPDQALAFGFSDTQAKLVYDVNARHQVQAAITAGQSRLDRAPEQLVAGDLRFGDNASAVALFTWRYLPSARLAVTQRAAFTANTFLNTNLDGFAGDDGRSRDVVYRSDWMYAPRDGVTLEGGGEARQSSASLLQQRLGGNGRLTVLDAYDDSALAASAYVQTRFTSGGRSIVPGLRVDWRELTGSTEVSPWIGTVWPLGRSLTLRAGAGIFRQAPGFTEVSGLRGTRTLRSQRAYDADIGIERRISAASRWQVTFFNREDRDLLRLPDSEPHLARGVFAPASITSRYSNALDGYGRGIEFLVQRRASNGLSGWASYSYGLTRYRDVTTGEAFWGDFDQRHTINLYGNYRLTDRLSLSARFRAGSNFPAPGYWQPQGAGYALGSDRNTVRVPPYSRLDVRANRTFTWAHTRLTLTLEGLNVYARTNVRFGIPDVNRRTLEVSHLFDTLAPFVPSAGILLEF